MSADIRARKEFRTLVSLEEARAIMATLTLVPRVERIRLEHAIGRVLAEDVTARRDVPPFTRSTMDGFAVRSADTLAADEQRPAALRIVGRAEAGHPSQTQLALGDAVEIATGALLPAGANAVVPVERTDSAGERVLVRTGVAPGENLMAAGDDLMLGDTVLAAGTVLGAASVGALAAAGETEVPVWERPLVGIASTGDEVRPLGAQLGPGEIHDANGAYLAAAVLRSGGRSLPLGILPDDHPHIERALVEAASRCALLLTSGSTSAGAGDVLYRIVEERGELLAHGVRLEPGKPTVLARLGGVPLVGLPGNPASAAVVFESLVAPLIRAAAGLEPIPERATIEATLLSDIQPAAGRRLLRMVGVVGRGEEARTYPIEKRSGAITLLSQADGYVDVPEERTRVRAGERVEVVLFEDRSALPDVLFMGSHCLGLPLLFRGLAPLVARSVHVGSLGGIRAVDRGVADAAGIHLVDPGGAYNLSVLERLQVAGVALVRGYRRMQGWILPAGNPRGVRGLSDVIDGRLRIVNRIPGSGTRVLLDELVERESRMRGVAVAELARSVPGWDVEAASHNAVAAAVRVGVAETGLGIETVAVLNGLDFVPVAEEHYDFAVQSRALTGEFVAVLRATLRSAAFASALTSLPGYAADPDAGEIIWSS